MEQQNMQSWAKQVYNRIESDFEFSMTKKATDKITNMIMLLTEEGLEEALDCNDPEMEKWTDEEKIKLIRVMLSSIECSIEKAEDYGYVSRLDIEYKIQKDNLDHQFRNTTKNFVLVILDINCMHDRLDQENDDYQNQKVEDYAKDPVLSQLTISQIKKRLENENKKAKKRRMIWNAWLDEVYHMIDNFESCRDSDVESSDEDTD